MKLEELRKSVVLEEGIEEPDIAELLNMEVGQKLLKEHMDKGSNIGIHFDVDLDGFSAGMVAYRALSKLAYKQGIKVSITTNKEREHGPVAETLLFCRDNNIGLLIIVDAGSQLSMDLGCDVLVLDHHEFNGVSERVDEEGYRQVVVSNRNLPVVEPMSGCEVTYEFMRKTYELRGEEIDKTLGQWVGVSIISDIVDSKTRRNQYYVREVCERKTGYNRDLAVICGGIDPYFRSVYRSYINYKLGPTINGIPRAGLSQTLIRVITHREIPYLPPEAKKLRDEICMEAASKVRVFGGGAYSDMRGVENAWRYAGLAASGISNKSRRATVVYTDDNEVEGRLRGSFRIGATVRDYLSIAEKHMYAKGHQAAFGFKCTPKELKGFIMELREIPIEEVEIPYKSEDLVSGDDVAVLGYWNNRVNSSEELYVSVGREELTFSRSQGRLSHYTWRGLFNVKMFEACMPEEPKLFIEMQDGLGIIVR